jgi:sigma-B regulation protein RsbU (phosphoserine phosphatase)
MATIPRVTAPDLIGTRRSLQQAQIEDLLKLQKAAQKITSILDLDQLIDKIVNDVARTFGFLETDIYLHEADRGELVLKCVHGCTCGDEGHRLKIGKGMVGYVASTGQMRYAPDVRTDPYYIACGDSTLSEVAIPLLVGGQLVGVFSASHPELDGFSSGELRLLQALCSHIAVAINNARLFQHERQERETLNRDAQEARVIQEALLPKSSPYIPGFAVSGLSIPAGAVGGDWYDFIPLDDGRWGLVLADVSGKGMAAALLMSATRGMLRSLAEAACSPGEVLAKLNQLMMDGFPAGRFVTLIYAVLDPDKRLLTFANAGHLPPLLVEDGGARFLDTDTGIPLGLGFGTFSETTVQLAAKSRLVFYSDGITEAENASDEQYGRERLENHAMRHDASVESILEDVRSFANGAGLLDDATVILAKATS